MWPSASSQEARLGSAPRLSPTLRGRRFYHAASQIAWEERRVRLLEMASKPLSVASANLITGSVPRVASRGGSHTRDTDRNTAAEPSAVSASVPSKKPKSGLRAASEPSFCRHPADFTEDCADGHSLLRGYSTTSLCHIPRRIAARCLGGRVLACFRPRRRAANSRPSTQAAVRYCYGDLLAGPRLIRGRLDNDRTPPTGAAT